MAVRLVNKGSADCDINLHDGRTVRLGPFSSVIVGDSVTESMKRYYRQLNDLDLFLEEDQEVSEVVEETPVEETPVEETPVEETLEELMKHKHAELVEMAKAYGIENPESLPKREISAKILEIKGIERA